MPILTAVLMVQHAAAPAVAPGTFARLTLPQRVERFNKFVADMNARTAALAERHAWSAQARRAKLDRYLADGGADDEFIRRNQEQIDWDLKHAGQLGGSTLKPVPRPPGK